MATVGLIVGNSASLTAGDTAIQSRLSGLGHTVNVHDDSAEVDSTGYAAVVFADSCSAATINATANAWADRAVGILTLEGGVLVSLRLASSNSGTNAATSDSWNLVDSESGHPIHAGLADPLTVYDAAQTRIAVATSALASGVTLLSTFPGNASQATTIAADTGVTLTSGTAPARRVWLPVLDGRVGNLTAAGWTYFDQSLTWAINASGQTVAVDTVFEADAALAVSEAKSRALGATAESDAALAVTEAKSKALAAPTENAAALVLTGAKSKAFGIATEADAALSVTGLKSVPLGVAASNSAALPIAKLKTLAVGTVGEADAALAVGSSTSLGAAVEVDVARQIRALKVYQLGIASEASTARIVSALSDVTRRPNGGTTAHASGSTSRPSSGITTSATGVTARPYTGVTARP